MIDEELYDLPTLGRDNGYGTFAKGTVTKTENGYHIVGSSKRGIRFGCYIDVVYVGFNTEIEIDLHEQIDVSGMEFRLGDGELHLRKPK